MNNIDEIKRLQESSDFWRGRANKFEIALREIVDIKNQDRDELASDRWQIAVDALKIEVQK